MENNPDPRTPISPDLGPRPTPTGATRTPPSAPPLSTSRGALLADLRSQPEPVTLTDLSAASGRHVNTVREHLAALTGAGLVTRRRAAPKGRGRPAWLYAAPEPEPGPDGAEYAGLAAALASTIHRTSRSPRRDATVAGTAWGRELADTRSGPRSGDDGDPRDRVVDPRDRVVGLLADLGFAPQAAVGSPAVLLTRCPLLETARTFPDVVCAVHLGIVRGALDAYGADPEAAALHPFSDPGACRLDLARTDGATR